MLFGTKTGSVRTKHLLVKQSRAQGRFGSLQSPLSTLDFVNNKAKHKRNYCHPGQWFSALTTRQKPLEK